MDQSTVYCYFENARFPAVEFNVDDEGRRVHERRPLHTVEGILIKSLPREQPPAAAPPEHGDG